MIQLPEHAVFWLLLLLLGLGSAGSLYKKAADQAALKAELPERILAAPVISGPSAVSHAPILFPMDGSCDIPVPGVMPPRNDAISLTVTSW